MNSLDMILDEAKRALELADQIADKDPVLAALWRAKSAESLKLYDELQALSVKEQLKVISQKIDKTIADMTII